MSDAPPIPDTEARKQLAEALRGEDKASLPWWVPQSPMDFAMIASGFVPGRAGRLLQGATTGAAVMSPREAHGGVDMDTLRQLLRDVTRAPH